MGDYPLRFEAEYPESPSRWLALLGALFWLKGLLLLPHILCLFVLGILSLIAFYAAYVVVLVTGRYPMGLFTFTVGVQRWSSRTDSWLNGLTDQYPPFSLGTDEYQVRLGVDHPDVSSRPLALLGVLFIKFLLLLPHTIILSLLGMVAFAVVYIGYWAVLITGRYPRGLFDLVVGVQRWNYRANAWLIGWADRYPPFSLT